MKSRKSIFILLQLVLVLMFMNLPDHQVEGAEVLSVETEGTIKFTGIFEPEHNPQPVPPSGTVPTPLPPSSKPAATPEGSLPQTSFQNHSHWYCIGIALVVLSLGIFYKVSQSAENRNDKFY